jgi:hypothetical protein
VLGLARRHRVEALAQKAFAAAGINVPPSVAARLAARTHDIARRNLAMAADVVRIQRAFDAAGIPSLLLKGVASAEVRRQVPSARETVQPVRHGTDIAVRDPAFTRAICAGPRRGSRLCEGDRLALCVRARVGGQGMGDVCDMAALGSL